MHPPVSAGSSLCTRLTARHGTPGRSASFPNVPVWGGAPNPSIRAAHWSFASADMNIVGGSRSSLSTPHPHCFHLFRVVGFFVLPPHRRDRLPDNSPHRPHRKYPPQPLGILAGIPLDRASHHGCHGS